MNGESEAMSEEDWSNLLFDPATWPLSRRRSSNESHHLLLNGDVKTTLLLNLTPGGHKSAANGVDIHTATIFESRQESSIFYQRQVDDVIVVNSKQSSDGTAQKQQHQDSKASNTSRSSSTHSVGSSGDPHKRLCNAAIAIAKKGYNPLCSKKRALIGEENTVEDTICKQGFATANTTNVKLLCKLEPNGGPITKDSEDSKLSSNNSSRLVVSSEIPRHGQCTPDKSKTAPTGEHQANEADLDIEEKILRRREMAHLFQWYYPEGGWGWIILLCAFLSQTLSQGLQFGFAHPLGVAIRRRFYLPSENGSNHQNGVTIGINDDVHSDDNIKKMPILAQHIGCLSGLCFGISLLFSPIVMAFCRKKSTRLTAVVGGLVLSLGILFTSFANQFYQLFFSYGTVIGLGICMIRDSNTAMLGQYFKKKRPFVEMILACSSGLGHSLICHFVSKAIKSFGWRYGLHLMASIFFGPFFLGTFYRSASLYHPQRRAIIHLKTQQKKQILDRNPVTRPTNWKELKSYKDKSLHFALISTLLASLGIYTPFVNLIQSAFDKDKLSSESLLKLQTYFGASWILGCLSFGFIVILKPRGCQITKLYLCIFSLIICGFCCFLADFVQGESGHIVFVFVYGTLSGGHLYSLRMYAFDLTRSRNFAKVWPIFQALQGVGVAIGMPAMSNNFSGTCLIMASFSLMLGERIKHHMRALKKHREHIERYHLQDNANGPTSLACQSLIIHHDECCGEKSIHSDEDDDASDEDDEEAPIIQDSILEIYRNRHKSLEAMKQWQQIEKELFNGNSAFKIGTNNELPMERLPNRIIENDKKLQDIAEDITSCAKLEIGQSETAIMIPPSSHQHLQILKQRFPRQPSSDEGCYTHSSTTSGSSSSGGSTGNNGSKYKMSAALTQAMVTAAIPVARPAPAAAPGHNPSKAIPEIQASLRKTRWQKQRSITVIEEVSA